MRAILTGCWCLNPCMLCGKNFIIQSTQLRNQSTWRTLQIALHPQPAVHGALSAQLAWKCSWHLFAAPEYETIRQAAAGVALYEYRRTSIPGKNRDEVEFHGHLLFTAQQITVGKGENIRFPYNSICQLNNFQHLIRAPNHHQFTTHPRYRSLSFPSTAFSNICTECVRVRSHLSTAEVIRRKCRNIREDRFRLSYYSMAWEILNNSACDWGEEQWGRGKLLSSGISIYHIISQFSKGAWLYCI